VKDPATAAVFRHGEAKNQDKKGFARLVKDNTYSGPKRDAIGNKEIQIGVPGVKQKSYRFTRFMRTYDKAFDLDDTSHFIGILKKKGLFGGFKVLGNDKRDFIGDDIETINPHNGFSHYLIFTNYTTQQINEKFLSRNQVKTLPELVARLKGTLVRIGPDTLELMDSQNPAQKGRSKDETPKTRKT
ncbi:3661_t:CDS:2, partial [Funneliformis geosporum]